MKKVIALLWFMVLFSGTTYSQFGNFISLEGRSGYISRLTPYTSKDNVTMEAWVYNLGQNGLANIYYNGNTGSRGFGLYLDEGNYLHFLGGGIALHDTELIIPEHTWTHIAITRNSFGTNKFYINGTEQYETVLGAFNPTGTDSLLIGGRGASERFNGYIDEFRFWTVVRSSEQIGDNYNTEITEPTTGLLVVYNFNTDLGGSTPDNSGNGLDGFFRDGTAIVGTVPVELSSFIVAKIGNKIVLNWSTTTETNNYGFEIEKWENYSYFGVLRCGTESWSKIGFILGNGTTTEAQSYWFVDNSVTSGIVSYRLKQIDLDGSYTYSSVQTLELTPETFELLGNYPNPFNPSTMINFRMSYGSQVTITVFDVLGRQIKVLVNEEKPAGMHQVPFNATGIASGLYVYQVKAGNEVRIGRMLLSK